MKDGHLVLDEPVDLPDGTVVDLMPIDQGDDLDDADRARLHAALDRSQRDFLAGKGIPAEVRRHVPLVVVPAGVAIQRRAVGGGAG